MRIALTRLQWRRAIHAIVGGSDLAHLHSGLHAPGIARMHVQHGEWFAQSNVVALAPGLKSRGGKPAGRALRVFVRRKLPLSSVRKADRIPKELDGGPLGIRMQVPLDVHAIGDPQAQSLVVVGRPALPGYNVGDGNGVSGTIGCVVRERSSGKMLGLSCAHVLASAGASVGAPIYVPSSSEAQQLGVLGMARIGTLASVAAIGFSPADAATNVDAATFLPSVGTDLALTIATLGRKPIGVRDAYEGLAVQKIGSTSGETHGVVKSTAVTVKMPLADSTGALNEALFIDQIGVTSFASDGDSGSLVLDDSYAAVGLHFWSANGMSVCQPIQRVLKSLGCDLA